MKTPIILTLIAAIVMLDPACKQGHKSENAGASTERTTDPIAIAREMARLHQAF